MLNAESLAYRWIPNSTSCICWHGAAKTDAQNMVFSAWIWNKAEDVNNEIYGSSMQLFQTLIEHLLES